VSDSGPVAASHSEAVLSVARLSKTYPGTRALIDVDFDIRGGEVHALLGGNGSGKSTLIKVLAGVEEADPGGSIMAGGRTLAADQWSPKLAHAAGLRFVHQAPALFPALTVAENIALGHGFPMVMGHIDWGRLNRRTSELLERYHVVAAPQTPVGALRAADRTRVAIIRALQDQDDADTGVLVLDEPTAALPDKEVDGLLATLRRYADAGQAILYVTHRLDEVLRIADRVTVLRDGQRVATVDAAGLTGARLVELIVGRPLDRVYPETSDAPELEVALEITGLCGGPLRGVDLRVHRGEVLGVAGLLGSGRTELLRMLFGAYPVDAGSISLGGRRVSFRDPAAAMRAGVAYVPEDRQADATFSSLSVRQNLSAARVGDYFVTLRLRHRWERRDALASMRDFYISAASDSQPLATISGGNQQKVVLARWLRRDPQLLLLDEPTQGVDINARAEIYALIRRASSAGMAVILVANDFEELARASDRVAVLHDGRITTVVGQPLDGRRLTELVNLTRIAA
jgi:ribose transport system ATP-binding protein